MKSFEEHFGKTDEYFSIQIPGRVNLIGEHTDYNDGFVMPVAINRYIKMIGCPRDSRLVRIYSKIFDQVFSFSIDKVTTESSIWKKSAEGVIREILVEIDRHRGMDIWIDSSLPIGCGLSSSAAFMAGLGVITAQIQNIKLDPIKFACKIQQAEQKYTGVNCGIMDQLAVVLSLRDHAMFIDCLNLSIKYIKLPSNWKIIILNTGVKHNLAFSKYNLRRVECDKVLKNLRKIKPDTISLRDVTYPDLELICDPVLFRRCRHVVTENDRVLKTVDALKNTNAEKISQLFIDSHKSLSNDYEVSCPELDIMVEIANEAPGQIASRMTGAGFGGATVNFVEIDYADKFVDFVLKEYLSVTGKQGNALIISSTDGILAKK